MLWFGRYSDRSNHLWASEKTTTQATGDTGLNIGWNNRLIPPDQTRTFSFLMGVGKNAAPPELVGEIGIWQHAAVNDLGVVNAHFDKRAQVKRFGKKYRNPVYRWQDNLRTKAAEVLFPNYFTGFKNLHAPAAYTKSTFEAVWAAEPELLARTTAHRFRSAEDVNQWVCLWWQIASGQFAPFNTDNLVSCASAETIDALCGAIRAQDHDMICLNDPEGDVDVLTLGTELRRAFETILPEKSGFEI